MHLYNKRIDILVKETENIPLTDYLLNPVHVAGSKLFSRDNSIAILLGHHDLLFMNGFDGI